MSENATPRTDAARERQRKYWEAINEAARGPYGATIVTPDPDAPEDGWSHSQRIERELSAANARIAELEKDAARYRWLRLAGDVSWAIRRDMPGDGLGDLYCDAPPYMLCEQESLDAAIDAAMSAKDTP